MEIIIITGPTGGHFFPGLAIGEMFGNERVKFFVPEREFIKKWLNKKNFSYRIIPTIRLTKKNFLFFPFKFFYILIFSIFIYKKEKPEIVIGTGSYVSVPFIIGAKILKKKIFIHEQNYIPGKATKFLSFFVDYIFLTFPNFDKLPKRKCEITGFPLISDLKKEYERSEVLKELGLKDKKTIVIFGGSQGSKFLNSLICENIEYFKEKNLQILHIAGKEKESVEKIYKEKNIDGIVFDFFYEMAKIYSICDFIICRSGAGTVVEIVEKKIPAFLIPYPYAGGHQKENAEYLRKNGGCFLMEENEENRKKFIILFEEFIGKCENIKENLKKITLTDKGKIKEIILRFLKNGKN